MRHSGNYGTVISTHYQEGCISVKVYVYDELDRFQTVAGVELTELQLGHWLSGMKKYRELCGEEAAQPELPFD